MSKGIIESLVDGPGKKYDDGKLRYDLMPPLAEQEVIEVLTLGAKKYGANNWRQVENYKERYLAAGLRHLAQVKLGNKFDDEMGTYHLANAMCCLLFLLEKEIENDNASNK